jgi:hypothetical protein
MNLQPAPSVIVDEAQLEESVHEKADPFNDEPESLCESAIIGFLRTDERTTESDATEFKKREPAQSDRSFLSGTVVG